MSMQDKSVLNKENFNFKTVVFILSLTLVLHIGTTSAFSIDNLTNIANVTSPNGTIGFSGGEGENGDDGFNSPQPPPFLPGAGAPSTMFNVPDWLVMQMQPITMSDLQVAMGSVQSYGKSILSAASEKLSPISDKFAEIFPNGVPAYLSNPIIAPLRTDGINDDNKEGGVDLYSILLKTMSDMNKMPLKPSGSVFLMLSKQAYREMYGFLDEHKLESYSNKNANRQMDCLDQCNYFKELFDAAFTDLAGDKQKRPHLKILIENYRLVKNNEYFDHAYIATEDDVEGRIVIDPFIGRVFSERKDSSILKKLYNSAKVNHYR